MNQKFSPVPCDLSIDPRDPETWPIWLSVPEAALVLRLSISTLRQLCQSGKLPFRRFGRQVRIRREDILMAHKA